MESFKKTLSALKIFLIEFLAVFLFPVTVVGIFAELAPARLPAHYRLDEASDWLIALVGPALLFWVLIDIFRPRVKWEEWRPFIGGFEFPSTHPSYVLIDALTIGWALFLHWIGRAGVFPMTVFHVILATAALIPLARLFAWYGLGLKLDPTETIDAYQPPLWSFLIFAVIFGGAFAWSVLN